MLQKSLSLVVSVVHPASHGTQLAWCQGFAIVLLFIQGAVANFAAAQDNSNSAPQTSASWPQLLGPNRDGHAEIARPLTGPWRARLRLTWKVEIGQGFAGPLIVGKQVLLFQRLGSEEGVWAFDATTGAELWKASWPSNFRGQINRDSGPRATPAVAGGKIVCFGATGELACIQLRDGKVLWRQNIRKQFSAPDGYFGAGSSPLILDDRAIVSVGGKRSGAGVVCVDLADGSIVWKATNYESSYASPIAVNTDSSEPLILIPMRLNTVLLRASDGKVLGESRFGSRGPTVNAASPVAIPGKAPDATEFWLSASYGIGTQILRVEDSELTVEVDNSPLLSAHYNTPVFHEGVLYGIDGYEGRGNVSLRAIDVSRRKVLWQQDDFGTAHLAVAGDRIVAISLDGMLRLIECSRDGYQEVARTQLADGGEICRATFALADQMLILRTSDPGETGPGHLQRFDLVGRDLP